MLRLLILLTAIIVVSPASSVPFPYLTSIRVETYNKDPSVPGYLNQADYYFTQQVIDTNNPKANWVPPRGYVVGLNYYRVMSGNEKWDFIPGYVTADGTSTFATLAMKAYARQKNLTHYLTINPAAMDHGIACFSYAANINNFSEQDPTGLQCANPPPPDINCRIETPAIEFDHQILSPSQTQGNIARTDISINCSAKTTIALSLVTNMKTIPIGQVGETTITANGYPLGKSFPILAGRSKFELKSQLSSLPPGEWKADSVLLISWE
ncbi:Uncharacterised protein [Serratia fonticola]|uniref:hypothetical protein n=1 Tax=Serratia fonticola TaxID=47917 RepID=UPI0021781541|nr:hypothetical protein [Serratia fonticola]CAI1949188.1 Uncharacterised protein [Serratia fonticola]